MILAPVVRGRKGEFKKLLEALAAQGFVRARVDGQLRQLDEEILLDRRRNHTIEAVVDRLLVKPGIESRLSSSIETAMKLANGIVQVAVVNGDEHLYSQEWACVGCGINIPALEPRSFSFNSVYGACEACRGLGSRYAFDPGKVIVDWSRPLLQGGLGPGAGAAILRRGLMRAAEQYHFDLKTPFNQFPRKIQNLILAGRNPENPRAQSVFPGVIPLLDRWYGETTSESYREWFEQYMSPAPCGKCQGKRLRPESLAVTVAGLSIADFTARPVTDELAARQRAVFLHPAGDGVAPRRGHRGAAHAPGARQRPGVAVAHRGFAFDPAHTPHRDAGLHGDGRLDHSNCPQDLDLMPGHGSDHSSLFPGKRSAAASPGSSVTSEPVWTGQNFRKGPGQNFRNPHECRSASNFPVDQAALGDNQNEGRTTRFLHDVSDNPHP